MINEPQQANGAFMIGLLAGTLVGGILAGLLAPWRGEETRARVRERGLELKDRAENIVLRTQNNVRITPTRTQQQPLTGVDPAMDGAL